ncbi:MAG: hypothetical protein R6U65_07125 [Perlabentimonas sp.]
MRNLILISIILLSSQLAIAQINAITETGDEVMLYQDGTWKYIDDSITDDSQIPVNDKEFF